MVATVTARLQAVSLGKGCNKAPIRRLTTMSLLLTASCLPLVQSECKSPPPAANFTVARYYGVWYEIGKFQTKGGGYFEKDCVCTNIDIRAKSDTRGISTTGSSTGDSIAINSCRKLAPTGEYLNATGQLIHMSPPGKWKEQFFSFVPPVDYTVIYLDDQFAVEYDCSVFAGLVTNYCVHIMARTPTPPDTNKVAQLVKMAEDLGLNSQNLAFQKTQQKNCWT